MKNYFLLGFILWSILLTSCVKDVETINRESIEIAAYQSRLKGKWTIYKVIFIYKNILNLSNYKIDTFNNYTNHFYIFENTEYPENVKINIQDTSYLKDYNRCRLFVESDFDYLNSFSIITQSVLEYKTIITGHCFFSNNNKNLKISYPTYFVFKNKSNIDSVYVEKQIFLTR